VKILQAVEDGMVLIYKRLERGTFEMPSCPDGTSGTSLEMRAGDLSLLLAGIDLSSVRHRKRWRQPPPPPPPSEAKSLTCGPGC
jgi:transposase